MTNAEIVATINSMVTGADYTDMVPARMNVGQCALILTNVNFDWYVSYSTGKDYVVVDGEVYGLTRIIKK